jgi:hypothetical protein
VIRERHPDGIDGIVDLVNFADGFAALAETVAPGGCAVSALGAADEEQLAARDVRATNVVGVPDPALLSRLGELADTGGSGFRCGERSPWRRSQTASKFSIESTTAESSPSRWQLSS